MLFLTRLLPALAFLVGCTVVLPPGPTDAPPTPPQTTPAPARPRADHLVIAADVSLHTLDPRTYSDASGTASQLLDLWHATLATYDELGRPVPRLAAALPSFEEGTWRVFDDGTMETIYRLRPGVTWHDGRSLLAADFSSALLRQAFDIPVQPNLQPLPPQPSPGAITRVETSDDATVRLRWSAAWAGAGTIREGLIPVPSHLIGANPGDAPDHPLWTTHFVGLGPYRVDQFIPGERLVLRAFERFWLGAPRIETVEVRFAEPRAAILAGLAAGTTDLVIAASWGATEGIDARAIWGANSGGKLLVTPRALVTAQFPIGAAGDVPDFRDARFRQALTRAVNRQQTGFAESLGLAAPPVLWIPTTDPRWESIAREVDDLLPYDPQLAFRVLAELGWIHGSDGKLNKAGQPLVFTVRSLDADPALRTLARYWSEIGAQLELVATGAQPDGPPGRPVVNLTAAAPHADSFVAAARTLWLPTINATLPLPSLTRNDRLADERAAARVFATQAPLLFLGWRVQATPVVAGIVGPLPRMGLNLHPWLLFNVHEWSLP